MLRIATEEGNQVHLKPKDLSVENLPSFAGVTMPSLLALSKEMHLMF